MASSSAIVWRRAASSSSRFARPETGQLREAHVDDVGGLHVAEEEGIRLQGGDGRLAVLRRPDRRDDGVDHVERLDQALDDVGPVPGLLEQELGPPANDLDLVGDVGAQQLHQVEGPGHAVDERDHVDAEAGLQRACACRGC